MTNNTQKSEKRYRQNDLFDHFDLIFGLFTSLQLMYKTSSFGTLFFWTSVLKFEKNIHTPLQYLVNRGDF